MPTVRLDVSAQRGLAVTILDARGAVLARGRSPFAANLPAERVVATAEGYRPHEIDLRFPRLRHVSLSQGTSFLGGPYAFESAYHYADDVRPSGVPERPGFPAVTRDAGAIRRAQRIVQGLGISVGPHGADGAWGPDTSRGVREFQVWYNGEPARERGPSLAVDGLLGPATQAALDRYAARASDRVVPQVPVAMGPEPAPGPFSPVPGATPIRARWGFLDPTVTLGTANTAQGSSPWVVVGAITALVGVSIAAANYLDQRKNRP